MFLKKVKSSEVVHEHKQLHLDRLSLTKKKINSKNYCKIGYFNPQHATQNSLKKQAAFNCILLDYERLG